MKLNSRLARWQDTLSGFSFKIKYRKGKEMMTDYLTQRSQDGRPVDGLRHSTMLPKICWSKDAWNDIEKETKKGIPEATRALILQEPIVRVRFLGWVKRKLGINLYRCICGCLIRGWNKGKTGKVCICGRGLHDAAERRRIGLPGFA
jgi:hypothetical protein